MKSKILLLVPLALLALSIALPAKASPAWYVELQLEITGFTIVGSTDEGLLCDVPFVGVAVGPNIEGTVEGVDHALLDWEGIGHLNVYVTITDNKGGKISAHLTGLALFKNPSYVILEEVGTIINELDPTTGKYYPTTGKYYPTTRMYKRLVGDTFRGEGFISGFSTDPPGGYIHVKWYWT